MAMANIIAGFGDVFTTRAISIDHVVFKLHYRCTVGLFLFSSTLLSVVQFIGGPVQCQSSPNSADMYCYNYYTFAVGNKSGEVRYHSCYEWVCFIFYFQAVFFCIPHCIWKLLEGNRVSSLCEEAIFPVTDRGVREACKRNISEFFFNNHRKLNFYAFRFFLCEILNFAHLIAQMHLTDYFLDWEFSNYGFDLLNYFFTRSKQGSDPMSRLFPNNISCSLQKQVGPGTETFGAICVLPLNLFNKFLFAVLWFWWFALAVATGMSLIWRATVTVCRRVRLRQLRAVASSAPQATIMFVFDKCRIGDWFLLYQVGKNIDQSVFRDALIELARRLKRKYEPRVRRVKVD